MNAPTLSLDHEQTARLLGYLQDYRRYTLTQPPSADRNAQQRLLQALQGKLIQESERGYQQRFFFPISREEIRALKAMVMDLCLLKAKEPQTDHIQRCLIDLTGLKGV